MFNLLKLNKRKETLPGYITISTVLVLVVITGLIVTTGYLTQYNYADANALNRDRKVAHTMANSCAEIALSRLLENQSYAAGANYSLNGNQCTITAISGSGNQNRTVEAESTINDAYVKVQVEVSVLRPNIQISEWQRVV